MTVSTSGARHLLFRLAAPARLPDDLLAALREEVVLAGYVRASGVLADVQVQSSALQASPRRLPGTVQAVTLEGSVGLASGDVSCGLRAVLAHDVGAGEIEIVAGDILEADIVALEVIVTAFDEVVATRARDASGVWLLDATSGAAPAPRAAAPAPAADPIGTAPAAEIASRPAPM
ncbi:MAG: Proline-rich protein, partial [Labilithrix sp.]|nr:Proline-rich protein [Labilithrix sp.]